MFTVMPTCMGCPKLDCLYSSCTCSGSSSLQYNGSLVVSPIVTPRDSVVGTISVDTLKQQTDDSQDNTFFTHEINFYQVC